MRVDLPSKCEAALGLAGRGWSVFPVHTPTGQGGCSCLKASCDRIGKHPRNAHGHNEATTDSAVIDRWWRQWPDANIGLATGQTSGLVVLDIDPDKGGEESLRELEKQFTRLPETVEVLTGGGGRHLYFQSPRDTTIRNSVSVLGPGLDIRGEGGYVVAPPSLHRSGRTYEYEVEHHPDEMPLATLPAWLLAKLTEHPRQTTKPEALGSPIHDGQRNVRLTSLAGTMRRPGMTEASIRAALLEDNRQRCVPPVPDDVVRGIAASVCRYSPAIQKTDERPSFPVEVLPKAVRDFVNEGAESFPCPPDFLAVSSLCLIGAAIARSRVLEVKPGWFETSRLWWGYVAPPGDMKTPALAAADQWTRARQAKDFQEWRQATVDYEQRLAKWEKKAKHDDSPKPTRPQLRQTFLTDTTIEALGKALQDTPRGLALIADELSGFFL